MYLRGLCALYALVVVAILPSYPQRAVPDISVVYAEGKITGDRYSNPYFGLVLTPVGAQFTMGGFVSPQSTRARLIDAEANAEKWEDKFSVAVLADALSANPGVHSPEQYVRAVRHQFEKEGLISVQEETPVEVSGVHFVQAIMKTRDARPHFQGVYTTFLHGYIVSLQVEAPSPERMGQIVKTMVVFRPR
jgi:hypothetical protein